VLSPRRGAGRGGEIQASLVTPRMFPDGTVEDALVHMVRVKFAVYAAEEAAAAAIAAADLLSSR
jgi:hypothetical protein